MDRGLGEDDMTDGITIDNVIPRADIVKRSARIGAEIRNIKLSGDLPDRTIAAINQVLLEHKVIFFRDQGHLDDAEQERFAVRLGKLVPHPTVGATKGTASILELDSGEAAAARTSGTPTSPSSMPIPRFPSCAGS